MMNLRKRLCATSSLALAFGLSLAACGDDGGASTPPPGAAASTTPKAKADAGTTVAATVHMSAVIPSAAHTSPVSMPEADASMPGPEPTDDLPVDTAPEPTDEPEPSLGVPARDAGPDATPDDVVDPFPPDAEAPAPECIPSSEPVDTTTCNMHFNGCPDAADPFAMTAQMQCGFYETSVTPELFAGALECYLDQQVDECASDAMAKFQACMEAQVPRACVTPMAVCDTLATDCTEITAGHCNAILSSLTPSYGGAISDYCAAGAGSGTGCGATFEACIYQGFHQP